MRTNYDPTDIPETPIGILRAWRRHREVCSSLASRGLIKRTGDYNAWAEKYRLLDSVDEKRAAQDPLGVMP